MLRCALVSTKGKSEISTPTPYGPSHSTPAKIAIIPKVGYSCENLDKLIINNRPNTSVSNDEIHAVTITDSDTGLSESRIKT